MYGILKKHKLNVKFVYRCYPSNLTIIAGKHIALKKIFRTGYRFLCTMTI